MNKGTKGCGGLKKVEFTSKWAIGVNVRKWWYLVWDLNDEYMCYQYWQDLPDRRGHSQWKGWHKQTSRAVKSTAKAKNNNVSVIKTHGVRGKKF